MKTIVSICLMTLAFVSVRAQERWTVQLNSKVLLAANKEDSIANVVTLKDIKKGSLIVTYVPGKVENERKRRLIITDVSGQQVYSKESFSITILASQLKKWRLSSPQVQAYTIPVQEEGNHTIPLQPVHLATIKFDWPYSGVSSQQ